MALVLVGSGGIGVFWNLVWGYGQSQVQVCILDSVIIKQLVELVVSGFIVRGSHPSQLSRQL